MCLANPGKFGSGIAYVDSLAKIVLRLPLVATTTRSVLLSSSADAHGTSTRSRWHMRWMSTCREGLNFSTSPAKVIPHLVPTTVQLHASGLETSPRSPTASDPTGTDTTKDHLYGLRLLRSTETNVCPSGLWLPYESQMELGEFSLSTQSAEVVILTRNKPYRLPKPHRLRRVYVLRFKR